MSDIYNVITDKSNDKLKKIDKVDISDAVYIKFLRNKQNPEEEPIIVAMYRHADIRAILNELDKPNGGNGNGA